jgi:hypothetical protein
MALLKQEVIDRVLSFSYQELARWIKSRLSGNDPYFPVYKGHEPNLSEFLTEVFENIKHENFRENFLEIMGDLNIELWGVTGDQKEVEKNKDYIYELLSLCSTIKRFQNKNILYRIARSGKLKGVKAHNLELHQLLLTTLASYHVAGDHRFWIEQMKDDSNKYYTNAAFYALINRKSDLDIVFKHIDTFINRFKGEMSLVWGIRALINKYGQEEIYTGFKRIETKLSPEQREAIGEAFKKAGFEPVYKLDTKIEEIEVEPVYKPAALQPRYVAAPTFEYKPGASLKEKAAEIFKFMGFDVEMNRQIAGHRIDIFLKKKKSIGNRYECWIGRCDMGKRRVGKDTIDRLYPIREEVGEELEKEPGIDDCQALIISEKGFTKDAVEAAKVFGIELKTPDQLAADLNRFYADQKQLIKDFESLHQEDADEGDGK